MNIDLISWLSLSLQTVIDPSRRLFWGFIVSAVILVVLQWLWLGKRITWRRVRATFFAKKYWLTYSTLTDVSYTFINTAIRSSLLIPLFGSHLVATLWVGRSLQGLFGDGPDLVLPWWLIATSYTLVFFVVEDFSRFYLHRIMHKVPFLWRFHKVHHSATTLTPLTLHRVHPVEMTLYYLRGTIVFSVVSGVFIYLAGRKLSALDILGVDALGFLFNVAGANLRHSHIWLSFGVFERWLISPAQHQIHHSSDVCHHDKNFGTCLAFWDKINDSWLKSGTPKRLRFGIAG